MNPYNFHLLSLIYSRDYDALKNFLADVNNLRRLRTRALRLGGWRLLNHLEKGIINATVGVLTRVRSRRLLDTLVRIFMKILPNLLSRFEARLLENLEKVKSLLGRLGEEHRDLYLQRLSRNIEYLLSEAWKMTVAEESVAGTVYML
jgi:hypothetical protein